MGKLEKTSLKNLVKQMETISRLYFSRERIVEGNCLKDVNYKGVDNLHDSFVNRVEGTYLKLDPLEQLVINNDFFYEDYPGWWEDIFSSKTYTYLRRKSIIHFLEVFYEE